MKFKKLFAQASFFLIFLGSFIYIPIAHADSKFDASSKLPVGGSPNFASITPTDFQSYIASAGTTVLNIILVLVAVVAVFFIILYGFQYLTAGGDPEKSKKARGGLINAIIGIIIIASAFYIVDFALQGSSIFKGLSTASTSTSGTSTSNTTVGNNPN